MKTTITLLTIFMFAVTGCSTDPSGPTFIPGFNATWAVENDSERQIDLQPSQQFREKPSGEIDKGDEILLQSGGTIKHPLKGSFDGLSIEFTIDRGSEGKVQYIGEMIPISETNHTIVRIELNSSEGNMALVSL